MAGENQYINPIIQAIMSATQNQMQMRELQMRQNQASNEQANQQQELKIRQQQADQAEENINRQAEYNKGMLQAEHDRLQAEQDTHRLNAATMLPGLIKAGMTVDQLQKLAVFHDMDLSQAPTREQLINTEIQNAQQMAQAQSTGTAAGQAPFIAADETRKAQAAKDLETMKEAAETKKYQYERGTQTQLANIRTGPEYQRNKLEYGIDPDMVQTGVDALAVGDISPTNQDVTNPKLAAVYKSAQDQGVRALQPDDKKFFSNINKADQTIRELRQTANNDLPDETKLGSPAAVANARALSAMSNSSLSTDVRNHMNELQLGIPAVMNALQGYTGSPRNAVDQNRINTGLTNVGTKQQALEYANYLSRMKDNNIVNAQAGMPKRQQDLLWKNRQVMPSYIIQSRNPQQEQQGYTLDMDKSIKLGKAIYDSPPASQASQ